MEKEAKKRTRKILEKWPPNPGASSRSTKLRKQMRRLQGAVTGKGKRMEEPQKRRQVALMKEWLESAKEGFVPRKEPE